MNWSNYGIAWHIDHIIPCTSWDFTNEAELFMCWHYLNLQPLLRQENLSKSNKYDEEDKVRLIWKIKCLEFGL